MNKTFDLVKVTILDQTLYTGFGGILGSLEGAIAKSIHEIEQSIPEGLPAVFTIEVKVFPDGMTIEEIHPVEDLYTGDRPYKTEEF